MAGVTQIQVSFLQEDFGEGPPFGPLAVPRGARRSLLVLPALL